MERSTFAYHRSLAPPMWAFLSVAAIELVIVHLLVALKWPRVGWPLSALAAVSILWMVALIRSFRRLPHELVGDRLTLRCGFLRSVEFPLGDIAEISGDWPSGAQQAPGTARLAMIAYPNRLIRLARPLASRGRAIDQVAIKLDDPAPFDLAMAHGRTAA